MNLLQALRYFLREAIINLLRGLRVSLLAVFTITISLVLGGLFLLASRNLAGSVERWRGEMRVVFYLKPEINVADLNRLAGELAREPWAANVDVVTAEAARTRFQRIFPTLADLVEGWRDEPLPASIEVGLRSGSDTASLDARLRRWRALPEIAMVDDDREWLGQLETVISLVRAAGLVLGGVLLGAAIFTIGSIIRLTAYLHHEEISILRLVGATEFYIRGPFYTEGLLQGLLGGGCASLVLFGTYQLVHGRQPATLVSTVFAATFLSSVQVGILIGIGAAAGLLGAIASLRREPL